jgi:hypothetical protein
MVNRYAQWLQAGSYAASVDRRLIGALWPGPASAGCAVTPATAMTVNIAIGQVAVPSQNNTGSTLCSSDATDQVTLTAANGTNPRIDVVTCHPRGNDLDGGGNNDFIFDFVTGTPAASPTVPATPAGQVALAQILVPAQSASISGGNITDVRPGGLAIPAGAALPAQAAGQVNVTFPGGNAVSGNSTVTFPAGRFTTAPTVMATTLSTASVWPSVFTVSNTSFTTRAYGATTVGATTLPIAWYATAAV